MRILLFHGDLDSLNHFTDIAKNFLEAVGCKTHVCKITMPLSNRETDLLADFLEKRVDAVILYDGIGMLFKGIYDSLGILVVNILVDHPMTFVHCMADPPRKYIQFSPDERHAAFSKKYWNIRNSFFLPHMGTAPVVSIGGKRETGLLFAGNAWSFESLMDEIKDSAYSDIFVEMIEYMLLHSSVTIEDACGIVIRDRGISLSDGETAWLLVQAKAVDEYVRMYYRDRALRMILDSGMDLTVIGTNWDRTEFTARSNFHWIPEKPFAEIFRYMSASKVALNVMPWFKAGSHERIFNALLSGACPVSDKSTWLEQKFTDGEDMVFYDLNELERLPGIIREMVENDDLRESIVKKGQEKVVCRYQAASVIGEVLRKVIELI